LIDFDFTTEKKDIRLFARIVPAVLVIWGTVFGFAHQWSGNSKNGCENSKYKNMRL